MSPKKMGTFVVNGVTLIYDGTADVRGKSTPIRICPVCGKQERVSPGILTHIRREDCTGACAECAHNGRRHETGTIIVNGVTLIYDGGKDRFAKSAAVAICPNCGAKRRVAGASFESKLRAEKITGLCRKCSDLRLRDLRTKNLRPPEKGHGRKMGTHTINGVTLIYDGVADKRGHSTPLKVCPNCGQKDRVSSSYITGIRRKGLRAYCKACRALAQYRTDDEILPNGAVIHWGNRTDASVAVTWVCGCTGFIKNPTNLRYKPTGICVSCIRRRSGPASPSWQGGRSHTRGYIRLSVSGLALEDQVLAKAMTPQARIFEHRLVMAHKVGRPLESHETVHHINGIKDDNRPENLELTNQSSHIRTTNQLLRELQRLRQLLDEVGIAH